MPTFTEFGGCTVSINKDIESNASIALAPPVHVNSQSRFHTNNASNDKLLRFITPIYMSAKVGLATRTTQLQPTAFAPTMPSQPSLRTSTAQHALAFPDISIPNLFESKEARRSQLKQQILDLASETERGLTATVNKRKRCNNSLPNWRNSILQPTHL